jgi:hypothetical protein
LQPKHSVIGQLKSNITILVAAQTKAHILLAQQAVTFTSVSLKKAEQTIQDPKDVRLNLKSCTMSYVCKPRSTKPTKPKHPHLLSFVAHWYKH